MVNRKWKKYVKAKSWSNSYYISFIVLAALIEERAVYLDVALVYALLSFLGVIVIARYIEGKFDGTDDSRN